MLVCQWKVLGFKSPLCQYQLTKYTRGKWGLRPRSCGGDLLVELLPGTGWSRHHCMQFVHKEYVFNIGGVVSPSRRKHTSGPPGREICQTPQYILIIGYGFESNEFESSKEK